MSPKIPATKQRPPKTQVPKSDSPVEVIRDIGTGGVRSIKQDLVEGVGKDFARQLFGVEAPKVQASGEIHPGESIDIDEVIAGEREENKSLRQRLSQERQLREEDQILVKQKGQELKVELHALTQEVQSLAKNTQELSRETKIAAVQAPSNPGIYHVIFFEKLREFIQSFRKKIENANLWLQSYNQRAAKRRTFWGQVGQSGTKRLLSPEDYAQRSAG